MNKIWLKKYIKWLKPLYAFVIKEIKQVSLLYLTWVKFDSRVAIKLFKIAHSKQMQDIEINLPNIKTPISLRCGTTDILVFQQIFIYEEYDLDISKEPKWIVDCGAYIGLSALYFLNKYPNAKVVAVEPQNDNFKILQQNLKSYSNAIAIQSAIWHDSTSLRVIKGENRLNWGFEVVPCESEHIDAFSAINIADLMKKYNISYIDILKIDIEGAEKEIFTDNYDFWLPRTKLLFIELHERHKKGCTQIVLDTGNSYGFTSSQSGENLVLRSNTE